MNEFTPQSTASAPTHSSDEHSLLSSPQSLISAVVYGHLLSFGLLGQIIFTFLMFHIPQSHHGNTRIPDSRGDTLMSLALCLPLVFAVGGAIAARWRPISCLSHSANIALVVVAIMALGAFDLFMLRIGAMAGYC